MAARMGCRQGDIVLSIGTRLLMFVLLWPLMALADTESVAEPAHFYARHQIDIPQARAIDGLNLLISQTGTNLLFPYDLVVNRKTHAVSGHFSAFEALQLMLAESELSCELSKKGAIRVFLAPGPKNNNEDQPMKVKNKSILTSLATIFLSAGVDAQESQQNGNDDAVETIVVSGIRKSLQRSSELKLNSAQISDSITAEDVGKFPDENVAESLSRIPGIQIDRGSFGEGSAISVRGLGPAFSRVFVNGRSVLSTGDNRQIDFRDLPSEFVAGLDVYKSPMASQIEGAAGGVVEVKSARPFSYGEGLKITGSAQTVYNELSEDWRPRISGQISNTFSDKFGALFAVQYQDRVVRQDTFDVPGWNCVDSTLEANCDSNAPLSEKFFRPRFPRQFYRGVESERLGLSSALQFRPTENLEIVLDTLYTERNDIEDQLILITGTFHQTSDIVPGTAVLSDNNSILAMDVTGADLRSTTRQVTDDNSTLVVGLGTKYTLDQWEISGDIAYSQSDSNGTNNQAQLFRQVDASYDYRTGNGVPEFSLGEVSDDPFIQSGWTINNTRNEIGQIDQDELNLRLDVTYFIDEGLFESIEAGTRYTDGSIENNVFGGLDLPRPRPALEDLFTDVSTALTSYGDITGVDDFGSDFGVPVLSDWVAPSILPLRDYFITTDPMTRPNALNSFAIEESTKAFYVQGNFVGDLGDLPFSGNLGVRMVDTDLTSIGSTNAGVPVNVERSYNDVLPSLNFRLDLSEDELLLRLAIAEVMVRPSYSDLAPRTRVNTTTFTATSGNPELDPFRATQLDLTLDWHFNPGSYISAGVFYKDVESFVQNESVQVTLPEAGLGPDVLFDLSRPGNGTGAKIKGFELAYQQSFDHLPAPFDGLGVIANYTRINDDASVTNALTGLEVGLEGLSKSAYNVVGYYEKDGVSVRLAYNWRDEFLRVTQGGAGTPIFTDDFGQIDLTASYEFSEKLSVTFDVKNLTDEAYRGFEFLNERLSTYNVFGRRISFGVRASF